MIDKSYILSIMDGPDASLWQPYEEDAFVRKANQLQREGYRFDYYIVGECPCGDTIELDFPENECPNCERLFNFAGQELKPVDQWEA